MARKHKTGFSLVELLTCIYLLGLISVYTIPKIVYAQQNQQYKAVFRETYAELNQLIYIGTLTKAPYTEAKFLADIQASLNAVKICASNSITQGCWTAAQPRSADEALEAGFVLSNGVAVTGIRAGASGDNADWIVMDVNGPNPPNTMGQDTIELVTCYSMNWRCNADGLGWVDSSYTGKTGTGTISPGWNGTSLTLFNQWMGG